jgi:hypothetical protein
MRLLLTTAEESAAGAALLAGDGETRGTWLELRNKVEAFRAFEHADALLGARLGAESLGDLVRRAGSLGSPLSVWVAEGVGYHVTSEVCSGPVLPRQFLVSRCGTLPPWSLISLHAGMGSAIAAHVLEQLRDDSTAAACSDAVGAFESLCVANADPEHLEVALEALGFVARSMFSELLPSLTACVRSSRPMLVPLMWHGIGRAIYFAPTSALPLAGIRRRALEDVLTTSHGIERVNTIAGFAWAATLVNLRDPVVLEPFLVEAVRRGIGEAFARGVHDALDAWTRCEHGDGAPVTFAAHRPRADHERAMWTQWLRATPARSARRAGDLFHVSTSGARYG